MNMRIGQASETFPDPQWQRWLFHSGLAFLMIFLSGWSGGASGQMRFSFGVGVERASGNVGDGASGEESYRWKDASIRLEESMSDRFSLAGTFSLQRREWASEDHSTYSFGLGTMIVTSQGSSARVKGFVAGWGGISMVRIIGHGGTHQYFFGPGAGISVSLSGIAALLLEAALLRRTKPHGDFYPATNSLCFRAGVGLG